MTAVRAWGQLVENAGAAWGWILAPGLLLGGTTVFCVAKLHPELYESRSDVVEHLGVVYLCYVAIAALLWLSAHLVRIVSRKLQSWSALWQGVWMLLLCLVAAFLIRRAVLARIDVLAVIGRWAYALAIPLGAMTVVFVARWMARPLPWRPAVSGVLLTVAALSGQVVLERTCWSTYAAPPFLTVALIAISGLGGALCVTSGPAVTPARFVRLVTLFSIGFALVLLGTRPPTRRLRKAVLVHGGVERFAVRGLLWPLARRLHLPPSSFWRRDSPLAALGQSSDPITSVTIDGHTIRFDDDDPPASIDRLGAQKSMVWILIDTLREDSVASVMAASPPLRSAYSDFAWYQNFRACSSMTKVALSQMLGDLNGRPGLLSQLNEAGYETTQFGAYTDYSPRQFSHSFPQRSDRNTLAQATSWLEGRHQNARPVFAFVHLNGGHEPVKAPGGTDRLRYDSVIATTFDSLSPLIATVPASWGLVVSGDHGEGFGEHGLRSHANSLYEELLKTPVLARGVAGAPGANHDAIGCPEMISAIRRGLEGSSEVAPQAPFLLALLDNREGYPYDQQASLTIGRYKSIWNRGADTWELYNLVTDREERADLSDIDVDVMKSFVQAFRLAGDAHRLD